MMADQCIVCLENLDVASPAAVAALAVAVAPQGHHPSGNSVVPTRKAGCSVAAQWTEDAELVAPAAAAVVSSSSSSNRPNTSIIASPKQHENHDHVAQIQICGHVLHDSCLREWTEKANSCPICRQIFNLVHVYDKVGGESPLDDLYVFMAALDAESVYGTPKQRGSFACCG